MSEISQLLVDALRNADNGWSIGTFGAVGEFMRDPDEAHTWHSDAQGTQVVTTRGGIRVTSRDDVRVVAYETLGSDGETWGNAVAFCLPLPGESRSVSVRALGPDTAVLRPEDRDALLFDLGVGIGHVTMAVRTREPELVAALTRAAQAGKDDPAATAYGPLVLRVSPARVLLSPLGRVEVYAPIPAPGGKSPEGPHTHLLPKLVAAGRTHSANSPIPEGLQPVLMMHPPSPWRDRLGARIPFDAQRAQSFDGLTTRFGLEDARHLRHELEAAVRQGALPGAFPEPATRHGRQQLRIILRRLAQDIGPEAVRPWRETFDHAAGDALPEDAAAA